MADDNHGAWNVAGGDLVADDRADLGEAGDLGLRGRRRRGAEYRQEQEDEADAKSICAFSVSSSELTSPAPP